MLDTIVCSKEKLLGQPIPLLQEVNATANAARIANDTIEFLKFFFIMIQVLDKSN